MTGGTGGTAAGGAGGGGVNPLQAADPLAALLGLGVAGSRFPPTSRYAGISTATATAGTPDGHPIVYLLRRFVPQPERLAPIGEHVVAQGERLDMIAAAELGDPELFWRVCDANRALRPAELTEQPGRRLRIALPDGSPEANGA